MRILVAEDERDLNRVITKRLQNEGYSVDSCFDGKEALLFLSLGEFDAVVLDIMMPVCSGLDVLREMRAGDDTTPVLLLTARDAVEDKVTGLDIGADDYMVKPFSFEELLARLRVMTRKAVGQTKNIFCVGDLTLDANTHTVSRAGEEISLSAKEYTILEYMMRNKGVILSREKNRESRLEF